MAKKAVKKEKSSEKKVVSKVGVKKKIIDNAPVEHYFIMCNGQPVKNVKELADVLEELREEVFSHHVTSDRNDFATWIHDVFKDLELAKELAGVKDKTQTRFVLYKHIIKKLS